MMNKLLARMVLAGTLVWMLPAHAAETIKLAVAGPFSGPLTQYGEMVEAGVAVAVKRINESGGANGRMLELIKMDDSCEPKQAVVVANRIVSNNIRFVVGHVCSGSTIPAADVYENEGVIMITPSATSPKLTEGKKHSMIFRTIGRDDQQGPVAAEYIARVIQPKAVAVLHDKQAYGQGIARNIRDNLQASGVNVAIYEGINAGESDYSAVITKLKFAKVDFVYYGGYHPEMGLLLKQGKEQGLDVTFMGPEGVANKDLAAIAADASEGLLVTLPADFQSLPENQKILATFKEINRSADGPFQMPAYAATQIVADAITATGGTDTEKVAAHIHQNTFSTPIGHVAYDDQGDLKSFKFVVYTWHKDGSKTEMR